MNKLIEKIRDIVDNYAEHIYVAKSVWKEDKSKYDLVQNTMIAELLALYRSEVE